MIQDYNFGIEIEMTGLMRSKAAEVVAAYFGTAAEHFGGVYDSYGARDTRGGYGSSSAIPALKPTGKTGMKFCP